MQGTLETYNRHNEHPDAEHFIQYHLKNCSGCPTRTNRIDDTLRNLRRQGDHIYISLAVDTIVVACYKTLTGLAYRYSTILYIGIACCAYPSGGQYLWRYDSRLLPARQYVGGVKPQRCSIYTPTVVRPLNGQSQENNTIVFSFDTTLM